MAPHIRKSGRGRNNKSARKSYRQALWFRPRLELLEDRTLLSSDPGTVVNLFNAGVNEAEIQSPAIVNNTLGNLTLPDPVSQSITSSLVGISANIQTPFGSSLSGTTWSAVQGQLQSAGLTVVEGPQVTTNSDGSETWGANSDGNYFEVSWNQSATPPAILIAGKTGFAWLDSYGGLQGVINANTNATFTGTMGVDDNGFFILDSKGGSSSAPGTVLTASLNTGSGSSLSGTLSIPNGIGSVSATATLNLNITADGNFTATSSDHKIRLSDLQNSLSSIISGNFDPNSTAGLNITFDASFLGQDLKWSPKTSGYTLNGNVWISNFPKATDFQDFLPDPQQVLNDIGGQFFNLGADIPNVGPLAKYLNQQIPLINQSIAQLTGLDNALPQTPSMPGGFDSNLNTSYQVAGGTLTVNVSLTTIEALLDPSAVPGSIAPMIQWSTGPQSVSLIDISKEYPFYTEGIPGVADVELDADFSIDASLKYDIGFGIDNHGLFFDTGSQSDPTFGLAATVSAGLSGSLKVAGLPIAKVGGSVGFTIEPYVFLAPADPDPSKGWDKGYYNKDRVYLSDLEDAFGSNPISAVLQDVSAGISGSLTGTIYATAKVGPFHKSKSFGVGPIQVFNWNTTPHWPSAPPPPPATGAGGGSSGGGVAGTANAKLWADTVKQSGGTVSFTDSRSSNNGDALILTEPSPNTLTIEWAGAGSMTYSGVSQFKFMADNTGGSNLLVANTGSDIAINADDHKSSTNDILEGGAGLVTLTGGSGKDTLIAGSGTDALTATGGGNDSIIGGSGTDTLNANSGDDYIHAGSGTTTINGGSGNDTLLAGSGTDSIDGGSGGNDSIVGGSGTGTDILQANSGNDYIQAGSENTTIYGGSGNDTLLAGSGTDSIVGGSGSGMDSIVGGSGRDTLQANSGPCYIQAGSGTDSIYGGSGDDTLIAGSGADVIDGGTGTGSDLIVGGVGNDILWANEGSDSIRGGTGTTTIYAGQSTAANQSLAPSQPPSVLVGGNDTISAGGGNDHIYGNTGGSNYIDGGSGNDIIVAGTGYGDTIHGGGGSDNIDAGSAMGPELIYGGDAGNNQIKGSSGGHDTIYGGGPNDKITGGAGGNDTIYGGSSTIPEIGSVVNGGSSIVMAQGSNLSVLAVGQTVAGTGIANGTTITAINSATNTITISNNATPAHNGTETLTFASINSADNQPISNNTIIGGGVYNSQTKQSSGGFNVIYGIGEGDQLYAGVGGNSTIYGGNGAETLYGGDGTDLTTGTYLNYGDGDSPGNNLLIAGNGTVVIYGDSGQNAGPNTLQAGAGSDALYSGGGDDDLEAGAGVDALNGGPAGNTFNLPIYQVTETQPPDILVGGGGTTTLVVSPVDSGVSADPGQLVSAIDNATTTITVTGIASITPQMLNQPGGYVIQIDDEQMLVNKVNQDQVANPSGKVTSGSNLITGLTDLSNLAVGDGITDAGGFIPQGTTIDSIDSTNDQITISNNATSSATESLTVSAYSLTVTRGYNSTTPAAHSASTNDAPTFVIPVPQTSSNDKIYLAPTSTAGQLQATLSISPGTLTDATDDQTTTLTVSNGAAFTSGSVIQIDNEQMQITNISGNTLTVQRGYNGTAAASHNADALIFATTPNGQVTFSMPSSVNNLEIDGGQGDNWIQVDPGVTQNLVVYGGPGHNTLMAGGGSDTLYAGSGPSVLYGGGGEDVLIGGDDPGRADPSLPISPNSTGQVTPDKGVIEKKNATVKAGNGDLNVGAIAPTEVTLADASGVQKGQVVYGSGIVNGSTVVLISGNTITLSSDTGESTTDSNGETIYFAPATVDGSDTLIAGTGNNELYAGSGNDVLIGGVAQLNSNGVYTLSPIPVGGGGRDILQGGAGDDLLIAGPGSPGEVLVAGAGNDTLVSENSGENALQGGPGQDLLLGGDGNDLLVSESIAGIDAYKNPLGNTLVGGLGLDTLDGTNGAGSDSLYAYPVATEWAAAEQSAAGDNVKLSAPGLSVPGATQLEQSIAQLLQMQQFQSTGLDPTQISESGTVVSGDDTIALDPGSDLTGLSLGQIVVGSGIANGTTITAIDSTADIITLSGPATSSSNGSESLAFGSPNSLLALSSDLDTEYGPGVLDVSIPTPTGQSIGEFLAEQLQPGTLDTFNSDAPFETLVSDLDQAPVIHAELQGLLNYVQDTQPQGLSMPQQHLLHDMLFDQEGQLNQQEQDLFTYKLRPLQKIFQPTPAEQAQLDFWTAADDQLRDEVQALSNELDKHAYVDSLTGGSGSDQLYGSPYFNTWMSGGKGNGTTYSFYNYHPGDTLFGGNNTSGGSQPTNTLVIQGDGTIGLTANSQNPTNALDVSIGSQQTGNLTFGFNVISGLTDTSQLAIGDIVTDPDGFIPTGTTIVSIDSSTQITVSNVPNTTASETPLSFVDASIGAQLSGNVTVGSNVITGLAGVVDTSLLDIGEEVIGDGIPYGATITAITPATSTTAAQITISKDVTSQTSNGTETLSFPSMVLANGIGNVTNMNSLEVQTLKGDNDTVNVDFSSLPNSFKAGLTVQLGGGNDTIDAVGLTGPAAFMGGSGNDTIQVNSEFDPNDTFDGGSGQSELDIQGLTSPTPTNQTMAFNASVSAPTVTVNGKTVSSPHFAKVKLIGGAGPNVFTSDGSVPNVVMEGGGSTSTNTFTANGGTVQITGGAGSNTFNLQMYNAPVNGAPKAVYFVQGGTGSNTLVVNGDPSSGGWLRLTQTGYGFQGSTLVPFAETANSSPGNLPIYITAFPYSVGGPPDGTQAYVTNLNGGVTVNGSAAGDYLDTSGMLMGVTLSDTGGNDTLVGGANSTSFDYQPEPLGNANRYIGSDGPEPYFDGGSFGSPEAGNIFNVLSFPGAFDPTAGLTVSGTIEYYFGTGFLDSRGNPNPIATTVSVQQGTAPITTLTAQFSDPSNIPDVLIIWGDGTATRGNVTGDSSGNFTVSNSHIYATPGPYTASVVITDGSGDWGIKGTTITGIGGLSLDSNNKLLYGGDSTPVDTEVQSFQVRNADSDFLPDTDTSVTPDVTVYTLHTAATGGGLYRIDATNSGMPQQIMAGTAFTTLLSDPYGGMFALDTSGNLYYDYPYGQWTLDSSGVQSILEVKNGTIYKWMTNGSLYQLLPGAYANHLGVAGPAWTQIAPPNDSSVVTAVSINTKNSTLNVRDASGQYWDYDSTTVIDGTTGFVSPWSFEGGTSLSLSLSVNGQPISPTNLPTAGEQVSVTVNVLDSFNQPVANSTNTPVQFTSSDAVAGSPSDVTVNGASDTFSYTFQTAGNQSLVASAPNGSIAAYVTVNAANASSASVNVSEASPGNLQSPPPTPSPSEQVSPLDGPSGPTPDPTPAPPNIAISGTPVAVTVTLYDRYGNVATGYTGTIDFSSSAVQSGLPKTYTFTPADAGVHTFYTTLTTAGAQSITISDKADKLSSTSSPVVVVKPATQLLVALQPPDSATAGQTFSLSVEAADALGNLNPTFGGPVTLSLGNNPGSGTLRGTLTVNAVNGVATFSDLTLDKAGAGYTLKASSSGLTGTTTGAFTVVAAPATQLVVTTPPPGAVAVNNFFNVVIAAEDANGNVDTSFNGDVTIALKNNPSSATLHGALTVSASNGIADFSLSIDRAGNGYTLQSTATSSTGASLSATTGSFNVAAGAATQLAVTTQPPNSVGTGQGFGLVVSAENSSGNVDSAFTGPVTIAVENNPGSAKLGGTLTVNAVNGLATFSGLTLNQRGRGYTLQLVSNGLIPVTSGSFNVAGAATQLVVKGSPTGTVVAGQDLGMVVLAEDAFGNIDPAFNGNVTVALKKNPSGGTLGGTLTVTAVNGVATWSGLTLDQPGSAYTLQATAKSSTGSTLDVTTSSFNVAPGTATQLIVTTAPPGKIVAGTGFGLVVTAEDTFGNVDPTFKGKVTIALQNNPGKGTLGGTLTVTAVNGLATFSGLTLDQAGNGYTLKATATSSTGSTLNVTTSSFDISAGTATQLLITSAPPSAIAAGQGFGLVVSAEDKYGNLDPTFKGKVTIALQNNPGSGTLGGTLTVTAVNGVATFSGLTLDQAANGFTLKTTATSSTGSTLSVTTGSFNISAGTATQLLITSAPPSKVVAGRGFGVVVTFEDKFGNVETSFNGSVSIALGNSPGSASLGGTLTINAVEGKATFSGLTLDQAGSGYTLRLSGSGLNQTTGALAVTAAAATKLVVTSQPSPSTVTAGQGFGLVVSAEDPFGNVNSTFVGQVTIALQNNPGGASLGGNLSVNAANGQATFSGLTLNQPGMGYTLQVSVNGLTAATTAPVTVFVPVSPPPPPPPPPPPHSPPPPAPPPPAAPNVPSLLAFFNEILGSVETVNANGTTITDILFGFPLVETFDYSGNLESVTILGIDITFLFG